MNSIVEQMIKRRSIRKFKPEDIDNKSIEIIIECGINAPTGMNNQPWKFTVIKNRELIDEISRKAK